ncbi:hypothetical protein [Candidatus Poriferisocius sp.]|uniref:hypothetical protein n=1 Tax=Candidatus Poriferisocius sp. TaxID=3101276 RepID=UPI003B01909D
MKSFKVVLLTTVLAASLTTGNTADAQDSIVLAASLTTDKTADTQESHLPSLPSVTSSGDQLSEDTLLLRKI